MTRSRGPMSENEKAIFLCVLIPILWPLLPAVLGQIVCEKIAHRYRQWRYRPR